MRLNRLNGKRLCAKLGVQNVALLLGEVKRNERKRIEIVNDGYQNIARAD